MNTIINSFVTWKKVNEAELSFDVDLIGTYVPQGSTISPTFDEVKTAPKSVAKNVSKPSTEAKPKKVEKSTTKLEKKPQGKSKLTTDDLVEIKTRLGKGAEMYADGITYRNPKTGYEYYFYLSGRAHFGIDSSQNFEECNGTLSKRNGYWVVTYDKGGTVDLGTYVNRIEPTEKGTYKGADISKARK
jgi:hypothetical protein